MKKALLTVGMLALLAGVSVAADDMNKAPATTPAAGQTMSTDKAAAPAATPAGDKKMMKKGKKASMKKQKSTMKKAQ